MIKPLKKQPDFSLNWGITFLEIDNPIELITRGTGENIVPEHEEPIWKSPPAGRRES
jgi:hypothetical protein